LEYVRVLLTAFAVVDSNQRATANPSFVRLLVAFEPLVSGSLVSPGGAVVTAMASRCLDAAAFDMGILAASHGNEEER